ncbi:hypothetical protein PR003_g27582 [Phytophthora rubi]|uniref:M96 mating-specific protein family n=1 Tax=Phytophthora rubi TaxID=129364 RepID=A0A6A4C0F7_9STRA|nr:hypothetical protein PR002_g26530 [Phytophthora rubi]KAE8973425.1 hypothetical protein PR001_g26310 [Phytophthora rubi]KAE9281782.1 hypothetical protein PR003_g27582 [Phytophthora rubi]
MSSSHKRLSLSHSEKPIPNSVVDSKALSATDSSSEDSHTDADARPSLHTETLTSEHKSREEREAIRKKIYHQRLKKEREELRQSVVALSKQLEELQHCDDSGLLAVRDSIWRKSANLQRYELRKAQAEQSQLLVAAKTQAAYIKDMCQQLPDLSGEYTADPRIRIMLRGRNYPPFDVSMYRGHVQRVIESYSRVDEVFQGFSTMEERVFNSVQRRELDGEVEYLQHLNKFIQPFSFEKTHKALWKLSQLNHRQHDRNDYKGLADPKNAIVIRFRLIQELTTGVLASVLQRHVIHRYEEENRVVLVWKTHSEGEGILSGMHCDATGWTYVQPALEEDSTEIGVCIRQVPMQFSISTDGDEISREFRRVLQNYVNEDMLVITRTLDRMLLEDTLKDINV